MYEYSSRKVGLYTAMHGREIREIVLETFRKTNILKYQSGEIESKRASSTQLETLVCPSAAIGTPGSWRADSSLQHCTGRPSYFNTPLSSLLMSSKSLYMQDIQT